MDELRFIAEIRKRPLLWQHPGYYHTNERAILWREVSECLGHDVKTCKEKWRALRKNFRAAKHSYEERIKLAKKRGLYDPEFDYSPRQRLYKDLSFLENDTWFYPGKIKQTKEINTPLLIAEVKKRPALWDNYHKHYTNRSYITKLWQEVAKKMGINETLCRDRWRYLKRMYRVSKQDRQRVAMGESCRVDRTKWRFFNKLTFIKDVRPYKDCSTLNENTNSNSKGYNVQSDDSYNENFYVFYKNTAESNDNDQQDHDSCDSLEQSSAHKFYSNHSSKAVESEENEESEESNSPKNLKGICDPDCNFLISFLPHMRSMSQIQNINYRAKMTELMLSFLTARAMRGSDFTNELEEQKANSIIGAFVDLEDPDCNFLVSFVPHLKSLARLEKLKFRLKMSNLILDISST